MDLLKLDRAKRGNGFEVLSDLVSQAEARRVTSKYTSQLSRDQPPRDPKMLYHALPPQLFASVTACAAAAETDGAGGSGAGGSGGATPRPPKTGGATPAINRRVSVQTVQPGRGNLAPRSRCVERAERRGSCGRDEWCG